MTNAARHPVTGNRLGDRTVSALAEILRVNTGLTSLSFTGNSFGQGGAYVFGDALKENNTLTSVDCSGTQRMLQRVGTQLGLNACQCYVADCKGDIPSLAALAAVESMLSNPECAVTSFDGFPFAKCVAKLGLPAEVARWSDHHVFHYIRESLRLDCLSEKGRLLIDNEYDKDMVEGRSGTTATATACYARVSRGSTRAGSLVDANTSRDRPLSRVRASSPPRTLRAAQTFHFGAPHAAGHGTSLATVETVHGLELPPPRPSSRPSSRPRPMSAHSSPGKVAHDNPFPLGEGFRAGLSRGKDPAAGPPLNVEHWGSTALLPPASPLYQPPSTPTQRNEPQLKLTATWPSMVGGQFGDDSLKPPPVGGVVRQSARTPRAMLASAALASHSVVEPWLLEDDPPLVRLLEEDGQWIGQETAIKTIAYVGAPLHAVQAYCRLALTLPSCADWRCPQVSGSRPCLVVVAWRCRVVSGRQPAPWFYALAPRAQGNRCWRRALHA